MIDRLRFLLLTMAAGHASFACAESVSPWVIDDATDASTEFRVRLKADIFAANDFAPAIHFAKEAVKTGHAPKPGTNRAYAVAQAGAFFDYLGFQVGVFRRVDGHGAADSEAVAAIQATNNKSSLDIGRTYTGGYSYQLIDMEGIRLGKTFILPMPEAGPWSGAAGVGISALHGKSIRKDTFSGNIAFSAADAYLLSGRRVQANSKVKATEYNAYLQNGNPGASGYASDFGVSLQHAGGARVYLLTDLASRLNWHDVPARNYSVQGFTGQAGTPLPSGIAMTDPFSSQLKMKTTLGAAYPVRSFVLEGAVTHIDGLNDPALGIAREIGSGWRAQLSAHPRWHALGLEISHPVYGSLKFISDNVSIRQAKTLGLHFQTTFAF